jgi:ApeA N-terminal domain 1
MTEKHTRLDSQFRAVGAFWTPDSPEVVRTGTLTVDERRITFTTAPEYRRRGSVVDLASVMRSFNGSPPEKLPVLFGFTESGFCTLCQLVEVDHPGLADQHSGQSIDATAYHASLCITGMHLGTASDRCVTSARYTFSGLNEWLPEARTESWENDDVVLTMPINAKGILAFGLPESHIHVGFKVFSELTTSETDHARVNRSIHYVEVESPAPESVSWYFDIGNRLENLFSLLTGGSLALETMFVYRGEESGHVIAKRNPHPKQFRLLDSVRCSPSQLANSMAIWLSEPHEFRSIEYLALGVVRKGKLFTETEFLSLAQALEGIHRVTTKPVSTDRAAFRRLRKKISAILKEENVDPVLADKLCSSMSHAVEPSFPSRLAELGARMSAPLLLRLGIDLGEFVSDVVVTRNFYTHAGRKSRASRGRVPLTGLQLFLLNQKMRALLRGVMLLRLQIPENQITELLVREATRWR